MPTQYEVILALEDANQLRETAGGMVADAALELARLGLLADKGLASTAALKETTALIEKRWAELSAWEAKLKARERKVRQREKTGQFQLTL